MSTATPRIEQPNIEVPLLRSAMYEMLMLAFAYPTVDVRERFNTLVEDIEEFEGTNRAGYLDEIRALRIAMSGTSTEALAAADAEVGGSEAARAALPVSLSQWRRERGIG